MEKYKRLKKAAGLHVEPETKESFIKRFWINLTHKNPIDAEKHRDKLQKYNKK
jgi:hypothetical protein